MYLHVHAIFYSFNISDSREEAKVSTTQTLRKYGDQRALLYQKWAMKFKKYFIGTHFTKIINM